MKQLDKNAWTWNKTIHEVSQDNVPVDSSQLSRECFSKINTLVMPPGSKEEINSASLEQLSQELSSRGFLEIGREAAISV